MSAEELLRAIAATGYFESQSFDPSGVIRLVEYRLNISRDRAVSVLTVAGFVTYQYDPNTHPRDMQDYWRLNLTNKGNEVLAAKAL